MQSLLAVILFVPWLTGCVEPGACDDLYAVDVGEPLPPLRGLEGPPLRFADATATTFALAAPPEPIVKTGYPTAKDPGPNATQYHWVWANASLLLTWHERHGLGSAFFGTFDHGVVDGHSLEAHLVRFLRGLGVRTTYGDLSSEAAGDAFVATWRQNYQAEILAFDDASAFARPDGQARITVDGMRDLSSVPRISEAAARQIVERLASCEGNLPPPNAGGEIRLGPASLEFVEGRPTWRIWLHQPLACEVVGASWYRLDARDGALIGAGLDEDCRNPNQAP